MRYYTTQNGTLLHQAKAMPGEMASSQTVCGHLIVGVVEVLNPKTLAPDQFCSRCTIRE